ncbi:MAG: rhomboid family intramembrane serine protease [Tenuifilaceae bacterium]|jgi:membrane associated rhomboid family serine protease|nr:rhomboid family intramembrane serine protease [Tenuifilaceae bacterium]
MTFIIIAITGVVSFLALSNKELMGRLLLSPYQVVHRKQWYRILSHALVHADFMHLLINMIVFLSFGLAVESLFKQLEANGVIGSATFHFFTLYVGGVVISCLSTLRKHKDNFYYQGVGASGAVSAVVFSSIFFRPLDNLYIMGILPVPAIIFGVGYLVYSHYMSKKSGDNINHDAHFIGAVYGFIYPLLIDPKLIRVFLSQLGLW